MIPRIQGKVGQCEEGPPEYLGKWFFTLWVTPLGEGQSSEPLGEYGPYDTKEIAHEKLQSAARLVCEKFEIALTGKASGEYVDMKTNERKKWGEVIHE